MGTFCLLSMETNHRFAYYFAKCVRAARVSKLVSTTWTREFYPFIQPVVFWNSPATSHCPGPNFSWRLIVSASPSGHWFSARQLLCCPPIRSILNAHLLCHPPPNLLRSFEGTIGTTLRSCSSFHSHFKQAFVALNKCSIALPLPLTSSRAAGLLSSGSFPLSLTHPVSFISLSLRIQKAFVWPWCRLSTSWCDANGPKKAERTGVKKPTRPSHASAQVRRVSALHRNG